MKIIILYIGLTALIVASLGYLSLYQFAAPENWRHEHTFTFDECVGDHEIGYGIGLTEGGAILRIKPKYDHIDDRYTVDFGEASLPGEVAVGYEALGLAGIFPGERYSSWLTPTPELMEFRQLEQQIVEQPQEWAEAYCSFYVMNYANRLGRYRAAQVVLGVSFAVFCAVPFILRYRRRSKEQSDGG